MEDEGIVGKEEERKIKMGEMERERSEKKKREDKEKTTTWNHYLVTHWQPFCHPSLRTITIITIRITIIMIIISR